MWALYSQNVKASSTFGRPPLLRLTDLGKYIKRSEASTDSPLDIEEPCPVDDVHIDSTGVGLQPSNRASVVAGFVIAVRLHMILERTWVPWLRDDLTTLSVYEGSMHRNRITQALRASHPSSQLLPLRRSSPSQTSWLSCQRSPTV